MSVSLAQRGRSGSSPQIFLASITNGHAYDSCSPGPELPPRPSTLRSVRIPTRTLIHNSVSQTLSATLAETRRRSCSTHSLKSTMTRETNQNHGLIPQCISSPQLRIKKYLPVCPPSPNPSFILSEFVDKFWNDLPLQIQVEAGYFGETSRQTISALDSFYVYCVKRSKVVMARAQVGSSFTIPLNSAVQFCLLYDPNSNQDQALKGFTFEKVSDVMAIDTLPRVICATRAWDGQNESSSVRSGEVLVVKKISKPWKLRGKRCLKVVSMSNYQVKRLPENCTGQFSTYPELLPLYLSEIVEHISNALPCKAVVYASSSSAIQHVKELLAHLASPTITLLYASTEITLVASVAGQDTKIHETALMDIPIELPGVEVSVVESPMRVMNELRQVTKSIVDQFDPSQIQIFKNSGSQATIEMESIFHTSVRKGFEKIGVELEASTTFYETIPAHRPTSSKAVPTSSSSKGSTELEEPESVNSPLSCKSVFGSQGDMLLAQTQPRSSLPLIPRERISGAAMEYEQPKRKASALYQPLMQSSSANHKHSLSNPSLEMYMVLSDDGSKKGSLTRMSKSVDQLNLTDSGSEEVDDTFLESRQREMYSLFRRVNSQHKQTEDQMKKRMSQLTKEVESIAKNVSAMRKEVTTFGGSVSASAYQKKDSRVVSNGDCSSLQLENRSYLKNLSMEKVLELLTAMGLEQYRDNFARERINGKVLCELDEDLLEAELGVQSRLHRLRIMLLVTGEGSAEELLSNNY